MLMHLILTMFEVAKSHTWPHWRIQGGPGWANPGSATSWPYPSNKLSFNHSKQHIFFSHHVSLAPVNNHMAHTDKAAQKECTHFGSVSMSVQYVGQVSLWRQMNWNCLKSPSSHPRKLDSHRVELIYPTKHTHTHTHTHHRCVGDTALAVRPRTRAVQDRGANVQSSARQRATISGTSCRRRRPTWSACFAVSKYQPPGHTAHQTVYCWQPYLSGCCSSSLERSARGRHLIVITAVFPAAF